MTDPTVALSGRRTILIVDDDATNLSVLSRLLRPQYRVRAANSGTNALRAVSTDPRPDLILLDIMMPGISGYEILERIKADPTTTDIPVIFLTALTGDEDEERGLQLGAADYVTKPIKSGILLRRVEAQLLAKQGRDWLRDENAALDAEMRRRMADNERTERVTIRALAHLAEIRDPETGNHILRTQKYIATLARRLAAHPRFAATLTPSNIELLIKSAPLHDIGKVGIPDHILLKPGPLDADEWVVMKTHAKLGSDAIEKAEADVDQPLPFLAFAKEIAHWHHEKWDGSGYPDGLAGEAIPVSARLMALADVFDALINKRVYKPAMTLADARGIIAEGSGTHFDPDVAAAFETDFSLFERIARRFADATEPL
jgi:putative two-component system response regulator